MSIDASLSATSLGGSIEQSAGALRTRPTPFHRAESLQQASFFRENNQGRWTSDEIYRRAQQMTPEELKSLRSKLNEDADWPADIIQAIPLKSIVNGLNHQQLISLRARIGGHISGGRVPVKHVCKHCHEEIEGTVIYRKHLPVCPKRGTLTSDATI